MAALVLVTLAAVVVAVLVGVGVGAVVGEAAGVAAVVGRSEAVGLGEAVSAAGVSVLVAPVLRLKPVSAAWPSDQEVASTPRLSTPTMFLVAFLTRRTPLSGCCRLGCQLYAPT